MNEEEGPRTAREEFEARERQYLEDRFEPEVAAAKLQDRMDAYDAGLLDGMGELAGIVWRTLMHVQSVAGDADPAMLLYRLGDRFFAEVAGCGDVIPEEFEECWRAALTACGVTLGEESR